MENTLSLILQDTQPVWYFVHNSQAQGPKSSKEIAEMVQVGAISLGMHLWKEGQDNWKRIYEIDKFKALLPNEPGKADLEAIQSKLKKAVVPPAPPKSPREIREWYVFLEETQYGPFSVTEMNNLIVAGRIQKSTYVWKKGLEDWELAEKVPDWAKEFASVPTIPEAPQERRSAPRKPLEAKVVLTDGKEVSWAVCRDISVGGLQVLLAHLPGPVGTKLKLNITAGPTLPAFSCEGQIVRILEDKRGFSFRFLNLSASAKENIEAYLGQ